MAEVTDIRKVWKKEKRRKRIWQFIGLSVVIALIVIIACNWSAISSFFTLPDPEKDLARPVAALPAELGGTKLCQLISDENGLLVLHDVGADRYAGNMKSYAHYAHSMSDPRAAMNGKWTVLYTPGASKVILFCDDRLALDLTEEDVVLQAAVAKNGYTAVATASPLYSTTLKVRSESGKELFKMETAEQITSLAFHGNGRTFAAGSISTKEGRLMGCVRQLQVNREKEDWSVALENEWVLSAAYRKDGSLAVVGSEHLYLFSSAGKQLAVYEYPTELLRAVNNDRCTMLAFEDKNAADTRIVLLDARLKQLCDTAVPGSLRGISLSADQGMAVTDEAIRRFGPDGKVAASYVTDGSIRYAAWLDGRCIGISDLQIDELREIEDPVKK